MADDRKRHEGWGLSLRDEVGVGPSSSASRGGEPSVPVAYAEKTMHSLLRLHEDLMEEKERRIDLYRRLMDREQELAELRAYVRLLEGEMKRVEAPQPDPAAPQAPPQAPPAARPQEAAQEPRGQAHGGPTVAWLPANLYRSGK